MLVGVRKETISKLDLSESELLIELLRRFPRKYLGPAKINTKKKKIQMQGLSSDLWYIVMKYIEAYSAFKLEKSCRYLY